MNDLPSLKQLHYLVALSEHLSFTRAAQASFVTQSTLSAGLKELEETLGARLVERDRQTVLMTPLGQEVVARARILLAEARDLSNLAAGVAQPMSGQLRLGIIPTIAPFVLKPALARLRDDYPALQLLPREEKTAELLRQLEDGRLDFALIALPFHTGRLRVEALFDDPLWLVGRKSDPALRAPRILPTQDLSDRLLLLEEGHCLREHTLFACGHTVRNAPGGLETTSLLTLVQMIESGLGLGLIPEMAVQSGLIESPHLLARPLPPTSPGRTIALAARRSTLRQAELQALATAIRQTRPARRIPEKPGTAARLP